MCGPGVKKGEKASIHQSIRVESRFLAYALNVASLVKRFGSRSEER